MNDTRWKILLGDNDVNGVFAETWKAPPPGAPRTRPDMIYITRNETVAVQDGMESGSWIVLGGALFALDVQAGEGKLVLTPHTGATGTVQLAMAASHAVLVSETGEDAVLLVDAGNRASLPVGDYRLKSYLALRKDDGGNLWRLKADASSAEATVTVEANALSALTFGEPFLARVDVTPVRTRNANTFSNRLYLRLTGAAGERITDLRSLDKRPSRIARSEKRWYSPKEATFAFITPSGAPAMAGEFKYG